MRIDPNQITTFVGEYRDPCLEAFISGVIDKDNYEFLQNKYPRTPTFYTLPKIHKHPTHPPGRPIVSGIGSLTEQASRYVDSVLTPHVRSLPSFIQDTSDLLKHIDDIITPPEALLVAIDIEALYSSIPHDKGVASVAKFLRELDRSLWPMTLFWHF